MSDQPSTLTRAVALLVEYDGTGLVGWQRQAAGVSVQSAIEAAALALSGDGPVETLAAGRTDAGVHAAGQVARLTVPAQSTAGRIAPERLAEALNFHLRPLRISIVRAAEAPPGWHPRFDAIGRAYDYVILDRRARPALDDGRVWHVADRLDVEAMRDAARHLRGRHDFTSFRATACQAASPVRTLDRLDILRDGDRVTVIVEARSFLHHMVRNIVGTLRLVGTGRWHPDAVAAALAARSRASAGPTAPPDGLTLRRVDYLADPFAPIIRPTRPPADVEPAPARP